MSASWPRADAPAAARHARRGVWRLREGEAYYAASLASQTTTSLTPDEIHEMGRTIARDLSARADVLLRGQA
jgi:uncharacterized protein (DUF885 family)